MINDTGITALDETVGMIDLRTTGTREAEEELAVAAMVEDVLAEAAVVVEETTSRIFRQ